MHPFSKDKISLYTSKICPFAHRAVLALLEANVPYEAFEIDLTNKPEWFKEVNPSTKVPTMRLPTGEILVESLLIVEYIAEQYPQSRLMPDSPLDRYKVRLFIDYFGNNLQSLPYRLMSASKDESAKAELYTEIVQKLHTMNDKLLEGSDEGPYFFGQHFTAADIAAIPAIERLEMTLEFNGFDIKSITGLERFNSWKSAVKARPSYSSTVASRPELIKAYSKYVK
ncbi:Glutathione S-transferase omega-1 [Smittium mucronatum]|uniref:Glutathione S-transferase omega-1 n=1 Tax=Smittium mucronatum TaxID=133383 RepID=A0A1R0GUI8_9FUNG|nr:Glutathione S-transferase omega-1 [Smittium mucronatum]